MTLQWSSTEFHVSSDWVGLNSGLHTEYALPSRPTHMALLVGCIRGEWLLSHEQENGFHVTVTLLAHKAIL